MNCSNCGSILSTEDDYCSNCGIKVNHQEEKQKIMEKKPTLNRFLSGCLVVFFVFFLFYIFFLRSVFHFFDRDASFVGEWYLYSDGEVILNDYFKIKEDGTFLWGCDGYGVYSGDYEYEYGITGNNDKHHFFSENATFYTLILHPTSLTYDDGTVITNDYGYIKYAIGIRKDGKSMEAFNYKTYNTSYLVKQDFLSDSGRK